MTYNCDLEWALNKIKPDNYELDISVTETVFQTLLKHRIRHFSALRAINAINGCISRTDMPFLTLKLPATWNFYFLMVETNKINKIKKTARKSWNVPCPIIVT